MNPHTGEIREFMTNEEARSAGFTVPLTKEQAAVLLRVKEGAERLNDAVEVLAFKTDPIAPPVTQLANPRRAIQELKDREYHDRLMEKQRAEIARIESARG